VFERGQNLDQRRRVHPGADQIHVVLRSRELVPARAQLLDDSRAHTDLGHPDTPLIPVPTRRMLSPLNTPKCPPANSTTCATRATRPQAAASGSAGSSPARNSTTEMSAGSGAQSRNSVMFCRYTSNLLRTV